MSLSERTSRQPHTSYCDAQSALTHRLWRTNYCRNMRNSGAAAYKTTRLLCGSVPAGLKSQKKNSKLVGQVQKQRLFKGSVLCKHQLARIPVCVLVLDMRKANHLFPLQVSLFRKCMLKRSVLQKQPIVTSQRALQAH